MFCSSVWHCLILADTKSVNTYHLRLMYRDQGAGGVRGLKRVWDASGALEVGVPFDKKLDEDGLMTEEADGES